jgi:coproporphyrinogen III oxidase-like Fe-S oxidoreductase
LKYWTRQPYLGFGVDAHSMLPSTRERHIDATGEDSLRQRHDLSRADSMQNTDQGFSPCGNGTDAIRFSATDALEKYVAGSPLQKTIVSRRGALEERFFLGLRLNRGVDLREIAAHFGQEEIDNLRPAISELIADGLLQRDRDSIRLTPRGRLLSNEVFQAFLAPGLSTKA